MAFLGNVIGGASGVNGAPVGFPACDEFDVFVLPGQDFAYGSGSIPNLFYYYHYCAPVDSYVVPCATPFKSSKLMLDFAHTSDFGRHIVRV